MTFSRFIRMWQSLVSLLVLALLTTIVRADGNLKTINNPGGGQIIYGPLDDVATLKDGMIATLKNVRGHFGDRPQIGRIFQTSAHDSIATFFTLTAKNQNNTPLTGMVIISMPAGSKPAAAVLYDQTSRFAKTYPALMAMLNEAWRTAAAQSASSHQGGGAAAAAPVPQLQRVTFPDNSGSIGLPQGWRLTGAAAGGAHVAGPHGEEMHIGILIQNIYDPRNPQAQRIMQYMKMGHNQFAAYPMGGDLVQAWTSVTSQYAQQSGKTPFTFHATGGQQLQPNQYEAAAVFVQGELDPHDGRGPMYTCARIGELKPAGNGGMYAMAIYRESVPDQYADEEWPTVMAILNSYRQNGAELQRQSNAVVDNIHAVAAANQARMDQFHKSNDAHNAAVEKTWDDNAKYNKSFENYQLDRTIIEDTSTGGHATTGYNLADTLVKSYPDRFQYVPTRDFIKDVDY